MSTQTTTPLIEEDVDSAAKAFAAALAETPEFQAFEDAAVAFRQDRAAQQAVRLFQEKQRSLQMIQQLGLLTQEEMDEMKRLREAMVNHPHVRAYVEAQDELMVVCQAGLRELSEVIGLDFAGACAPGCC